MPCTAEQKSLYDYFLVIFPLIVSVAVGFIGWFQFKINKHKLRLDLYNRRFSVYEKTLSYFQSYYSRSHVPESTASSASEFIRAYRESIFLFGADSAVHKKLTELKDTLGFLIQFDEKFRSDPYDKDEYKVWSEKKQSIADASTLMKALENDLLPWLDFRNVEK